MTVTIDQDLNPTDRYKAFLKLFSAHFNLNLSDKEIEILNEFHRHHEGKFNPDTRNSVATKLGMSSFNLNNYIGKLKLRNVVHKKGLNTAIMINTMAAEKSFGVLFNFKS
jgi:hypothetical protein